MLAQIAAGWPSKCFPRSQTEAPLRQAWVEHRMRTTDVGKGFVAGTRVHTRKGLVPIEEIEVGDGERSQAEDQGEHTCRRVLKAISFDDKETLLVRFHKKGPGQDSLAIEQVAVACGHPLWRVGRGWMQAGRLEVSEGIALHDGSHASVICSRPVLTTAGAGIGWVVGGWGVEMNGGSGNRVHCRHGGMPVELDESIN